MLSHFSCTFIASYLISQLHLLHSVLPPLSSYSTLSYLFIQLFYSVLFLLLIYYILSSLSFLSSFSLFFSFSLSLSLICCTLVFSLPLIYYMLPYLSPSVIVTCPVPLFSYPILLTLWFSNCILSSFSFLLSFIASFIAPLHLLRLVLFFCSAILSCLIFYAQLLHPVLGLLLS